MGTLEKILENVEALKRDLHAVVVVGEEKSHTELVDDWEAMPDDNFRWIGQYPEKIIDDTGTIIDWKKRDAAQKALTDIFKGSEFYSVRYAAGRALLGPYTQLESELPKSLMSLGQQWGNLTSHAGKSFKKRLQSSNGAIKLDAIQDAGMFFHLSGSATIQDLLKEVYDSKTASLVPTELSRPLGFASNAGYARKLRNEAGRQLGLHPYQIWVHENRLFLTGITATASASGITYMIESFEIYQFCQNSLREL